MRWGEAGAVQLLFKEHRYHQTPSEEQDLDHATAWITNTAKPRAHRQVSNPTRKTNAEFRLKEITKCRHLA